MKNVLKKIGNVLLVLVVIIEILCIIFVVMTKISGGIPNLFGHSFYVIVSPSMEPEIKVGDVIISRIYDGEDLNVGDVITYNGKSGDVAGKVITHKIVKLEGEGDGLKITTRGIANTADDPVITKADVVSVMVYKTVVISGIYMVISNFWGFMFLVILPMITIIVTEIIGLIKKIKEEYASDGETEEGDTTKTEKGESENEQNDE